MTNIMTEKIADFIDNADEKVFDKVLSYFEACEEKEDEFDKQKIIGYCPKCEKFKENWNYCASCGRKFR